MFLLLITTGLNAQITKPSFSQNVRLSLERSTTPKALTGYAVAFIGGAANGVHETISHHYGQFKKVHPNANDQYWNPEISWKNKYEDFDNGNMSSNYMGAKTYLAWTTDAKHLMSVTSNASLIGATAIITIGSKQKWYDYAIQIIAMSAARSAGFHLTYSLIYK